MQIRNLDMYQRLRDFNIPTAILDDIFAHEEELKTLKEAWISLEQEGLKGDDIAYEISVLIYKEIDLPADYSSIEK